VSSQSIVLRWKDVVVSIVDCVEVVRSISGWDIYRRNCVVLIVNPIDVLARFRCLVAEARPLDGCPER
jgi:hypothetical protein